MTPQEWLTSNKPLKMLDYLFYVSYPELDGYNTQSSRSTPLITIRKLQLFACGGCCRQVWDQLPSQ